MESPRPGCGPILWARRNAQRAEMLASVTPVLTGMKGGACA